MLNTLPNIDLKKIAGQMLLLGFRGDSANENSDIYKEIHENHVGGVILFDKDMVHNKPVHNIKSPEQVRELTNTLQSYSEFPLFVGVDQEGGLVNRLKSDYGFPQTVSHLQIGKKNDLAYTYEQASLIAKTLKSVGINLNFAPVVDLDVNEANPIIHKKERSFSANVDEVVNHARVYSKAHKEQGILTTLKHFPGHGSSFGDSHLGFTDVTETWTKIELEPYYKLIKEEGFDEFVMTTHIFNSKLDAEHPATLSHNVLSGILKNEMGFKGLLISDDMQMRAITDKYGLDQAVVLAINAGVDVMCFGNNLAKEPITSAHFVQFLEKGLRNKQLTEEQLLHIYHRILAFKTQKLKQIHKDLLIR